jgi:hypothetical protein
VSLSCCLVHCCFRKSNSDSARASSSRSSTTRRSWKAIKVKNVAFASSSAVTSSCDEEARAGLEIARSWVPWIGDMWRSPRELLGTCLEGDIIGVDRRGVLALGLVLIVGAVALLVGGRVILMRLLRGEWDGRGEDSSNRTGLRDLGELYGWLVSFVVPVGLGIDSFDSRSTRVNLASPREVVWDEGNAGTD